MANTYKIDTHTHILPPEIPDFGFDDPRYVRVQEIPGVETTDRQMMKGKEFFRRVQCNCFDHKERIKECDEQGVKVQVLSTVPVMFNHWADPDECMVTSRYINDHLASVCQENPTRFVGLCTVPMQKVEYACEELKRCVTELGLKGVEIGTHVNGRQLDEPEFLPFWELTEKLGGVVFIHPWEMMGFKRLERHWLPWLVSMPAESSAAICAMIFGGIYKKFPNLKVYYAHGGGSFIGTLARIQKGFDCQPDLYPDQCNPKDYLKHIVVDSLTHDPDMLLKLIRELGPNNIMVGSDYPFPLGELYPPGGTVVKACDDKLISPEVRDQILFENASRFFGLGGSKVLKHDRNKLRITLAPSLSETKVVLDQIPNIKHKIASDIRQITTDPVTYSTEISVKILAQILTEMCRQYYTGKEKPYVDNGTYDKLVKSLRTRDGANAFFA